MSLEGSPAVGLLWHWSFLTIWSFSHVVGPCHPLRKDPDLDYDIDSDEDWEEVICDAFWYNVVNRYNAVTM